VWRAPVSPASQPVREVEAGAELRVIPDAGHCYFLEGADAFNELCLDFLARSSSRKD